MRATWDELPAAAQYLITSRRHRNKHARRLYYWLVTIPAEDAYLAWLEDLADAHGSGDEKRIERVYAERYRHAEISAWDVPARDEWTVDDGGYEDDDVTVH